MGIAFAGAITFSTTNRGRQFFKMTGCVQTFCPCDPLQTYSLLKSIYRSVWHNTNRHCLSVSFFINFFSLSTDLLCISLLSSSLFSFTFFVFHQQLLSYFSRSFFLQNSSSCSSSNLQTQSTDGPFSPSSLVELIILVFFMLNQFIQFNVNHATTLSAWS